MTRCQQHTRGKKTPCTYGTTLDGPYTDRQRRADEGRRRGNLPTLRPSRRARICPCSSTPTAHHVPRRVLFLDADSKQRPTENARDGENTPIHWSTQHLTESTQLQNKKRTTSIQTRPQLRGIEALGCLYKIGHSYIEALGILRAHSYRSRAMALFNLHTLLPVSYTHLTLPTNREV